MVSYVSHYHKGADNMYRTVNHYLYNSRKHTPNIIHILIQVLYRMCSMGHINEMPLPKHRKTESLLKHSQNIFLNLNFYFAV